MYLLEYAVQSSAAGESAVTTEPITTAAGEPSWLAVAAAREGGGDSRGGERPRGRGQGKGGGSILCSVASTSVMRAEGRDTQSVWQL